MYRSISFKYKNCLLELMPKNEESLVLSETGNWNVAADFSKLKIMRQLYLADDYESVAKFGTSLLYDEFTNPYPQDVLRKKGFERLVDTLIKIIDNSIFAVKDPESKDKLNTLRSELCRIEKLIPKLSRTVKKRLSSPPQLEILNEVFNPIFERVRIIKSEINEPLNKNDLIFTNRKEFDKKKFKEGIKNRVINHG